MDRIPYSSLTIAILTVVCISCASPQQALVATPKTSKTHEVTHIPDLVRERKELKVYNVEQRESNWCWAACTEMILEYFGNEKRQCSIVEDYLKSENRVFHDACRGKDRHTYNTVGWPDLTQYNLNWNVTTKKKYYNNFYLDSALKERDLIREIEAGRPLMWSYTQAKKTNGKAGSGHMVVIKGYYKLIDGSIFLVCADPRNNSNDVFYSLKEYSRTHWRTFYNISKIESL